MDFLPFFGSASGEKVVRLHLSVYIALIKLGITYSYIEVPVLDTPWDFYSER